MKKIIKKSSIKKAQNGSIEDQVRQANIAKNAQTRGYVLKKAQLVKDQESYATSLPETIGGGRKLTPQELSKKQAYKDSIKSYGDSIQMNRLNLSQEALLKKYAEGKKYGLKQKDSNEGGGLRCIGKSTQGCSGSESANARRLSSERNRKNGGSIKKVTKTMKPKKQAGGVVGKEPKAPNKKGAFVTVQRRTLAKKKK